VSFQGAGTCTLDFNDSGNANYVGATQVQLKLIALHRQSPLRVTNVVGEVGHSLVLRASGGLGSGVVTFNVVDGTASGCSLNAGRVVARRQGTCLVTATKTADTNYESVSSPITAVEFRMAARITRVVSTVLPDHTTDVMVDGVGFFGLPKIIDANPGVRASVIKDTGHQLMLRVWSPLRTRPGIYVISVKFADGQVLRVRYREV
jgi:hypothetical protein